MHQVQMQNSYSVTQLRECQPTMKHSRMSRTIENAAEDKLSELWLWTRPFKTPRTAFHRLCTTKLLEPDLVQTEVDPLALKRDHWHTSAAQSRKEAIQTQFWKALSSKEKFNTVDLVYLRVEKTVFIKWPDHTGENVSRNKSSELRKRRKSPIWWPTLRQWNSHKSYPTTLWRKTTISVTSTRPEN